MNKFLILTESICKKRTFKEQRMMNEILGFGGKGRYKFQIQAVASQQHEKKGTWVVLDTVTFPQKKTKDVLLAWLHSEAFKHKSTNESELLEDIAKAYKIKTKTFRVLLLSEEETEYTTDSLNLRKKIKYPKLGKHNTVVSDDDDEMPVEDTTSTTSGRTTTRTPQQQEELPTKRDVTALYRSGKTYQEIADLYGVTKQDILDVLKESHIVRTTSSLLNDVRYAKYGKKINEASAGDFFLKLAGMKGDNRFMIFGVAQDPVLKKKVWKNLGEYRFNVKKPKDALKIWFQSIVTANAIMDSKGLLSYITTAFKLSTSNAFKILPLKQEPPILKSNTLISGLKYSKNGMSQTKKAGDELTQDELDAIQNED